MGLGIQTLCDPIVASASCYSAGTELWDLAQRNPRAEQPRTCSPGLGPGEGCQQPWRLASIPLSGALNQTQQVTSQKAERKQRRRQDKGEKTKLWTRRVFLNTNPVVLKAGTGPWTRKTDFLSQCVKEKAANQLNRNWNLFPSSLFPVTRGTRSALKYTLGITWQAALLC